MSANNSLAWTFLPKSDRQAQQTHPILRRIMHVLPSRQPEAAGFRGARDTYCYRIAIVLSCRLLLFVLW